MCTLKITVKLSSRVFIESMSQTGDEGFERAV